MTAEKTETTAILCVPFNLCRAGGNGITDGELRLYGTYLEVLENSEVRDRLSLETVKEIVYDSGIGCASIEARLEDGYVTLARADSTMSATLSTAAKRINRYLDGAQPEEGWNRFKGVLCPKCKRPYPPGTELCPRCAGKKSYLKKFWAIARPYRGWIFLSLVLYLGIAAASLLGPYLNRILVDDYIKAQTMPAVFQFIAVILAILGADLLTRLLRMLRGYVQTLMSSKVISYLRNLLFTKIQQLSLASISKKTTGELMNRVTADTDNVRQLISEELGNFLQNMAQLLAICVIIFSYDWRLALLMVFPVPFVLLCYRLMHKYLHAKYGRQWNLYFKTGSVLHDILSGIRVVKAFGMEKKELERYDEVSSKERDAKAEAETAYAYITPVSNFLMGMGEFFLLYYVGNKILAGEMTLGEMQQFSAYAFMIYSPLHWLSNLPRRLNRYLTSLVKIFDLLDEKPDVTDTEKPLEPELSGNIEINNISFGYEDSKNVLKNVSLSIKAGEMIGIVGRSGVGKSTLINLLMRLYDVEEGSITLDGTDIRDISQECLRRQIGVVLQDTLLFTGTLYQNIAYGKPGATREEIINAAKLSGVHRFAVKLPDGYDTVIGEKGYTLSGGERKRVAIARAILHSPKILILDEATSSLDTETEKEIQDSLQRLSAGITTIAIAHRLSTLRNATRLVVLDRGTVAETGTHEELMRKGGLYYELVMAQRQMSKMPD